MALAIVVAVVVVVLAALPLALMRRRDLAYRRANPEWWASWKRADRAQKRRVRVAMRQGSMLHDPGDARLLIGLSRRADALERRHLRRREWLYAAASLAAAVLAVASGNPRLVVQAVAPAVVLLVFSRFFIAPMRRRRQRAAEVNREVAGEPGSRGTTHSA